MIYLDCAATSLQKPAVVASAVVNAMRTMTSPGRGGYGPSMLAAEMTLDCRETIAELFRISSPEQVVFTLNATHALNIAIQTLVKKGERVVISGYEHNSVTRPLAAIGADVAVVNSPLFDIDAAVRGFEEVLPGAKCCVCTQVSNVFGFILPIEKIAEICRKNAVRLIIDASQSAGSVDLNFGKLGADFAAMPGHKGLCGPQGTGILLCSDVAEPILFGGTGSMSAFLEMPDFLPDRLEAGTHNITGIAGLNAGVKYVANKTPAAILAHERELMRMMSERLSEIPGANVYAAEDFSCQAGLLSVKFEGIDSEDMAAELGGRGVCVRAGLHCAPAAHRTVGTIASGTVRYSFSPFNTMGEVIRATEITADIMRRRISEKKV